MGRELKGSVERGRYLFQSKRKYSDEISSLWYFTAQKMKFFIKDFSSKCDPADLVTFTGEILNGKLHFLCSIFSSQITINDRNYDIQSYVFQNNFLFSSIHGLHACFLCISF